MKRENPPCTPYKRKAKGKEIIRGFYENPLSPRARMRTRETVSRYRLAGGASREIMKILGSTSKDDFLLWCYYCNHHDIEIILEHARECASRWRQGELDEAIPAFQRWLTDTYGEEADR